MSSLAQVWLSMKEYEKAVDECEAVFALDAGYYPAYLTRQEAYFEMRNAQGVVDDYHRAVEIYPGHYKPYLMAIQVFLIYDQYDDAKQTLDRALEPGDHSVNVVVTQVDTDEDGVQVIKNQVAHTMDFHVEE